MSTSCKARITGYYGGQAVALGLILLALHFPAGAQTRGAIPIAFGQTVQGTLTSTDRLLEDGRPIDTYIFNVTAPRTRYLIIARSPDIPLISSLSRVTQAGFADQQAAAVFSPGQTLGYFGVIDQPGQYEVDVRSSNPQRPTGPSGTASYSLSLVKINLDAQPPAALPAQ